jgi:hypothetical protein
MGEPNLQTAMFWCIIAGGMFVGAFLWLGRDQGTQLS